MFSVILLYFFQMFCVFFNVVVFCLMLLTLVMLVFCNVVVFFEATSSYKATTEVGGDQNIRIVNIELVYMPPNGCANMQWFTHMLATTTLLCCEKVFAPS